MLVRDAMTRDPKTIAPSATLAEAEEVMQRGRFRHLPVVADGRLAGIISEREARPPAGVTPELARSLSGRPVSTVMQRNVISIAADDPIEQAASLLHINKIGCLPVLRGGHLEGIITTSDVFAAFVRTAGLLEPSTRFEVRASNLAPVLGAIAAVADRERFAIAGLLTERDGDTGEQRVIVRFSSLQGPRIAAALRAAGVDLLGPDPAAEAVS
jgi:acetoin utilization protein AcuB